MKIKIFQFNAFRENTMVLSCQGGANGTGVSNGLDGAGDTNGADGTNVSGTSGVSDASERGCVVVDPGCCDADECAALFGYIDGNGLKPEAILLTHGHADHIAGVAAVQKRYGCPAYINSADEKALEYNRVFCKVIGFAEPNLSFKRTDAADGTEICCAGFRFRVIATPGHSEGGVCYYEPERKLLLSGDTLFAGTIGRSDLKYGDYDSLIRSIMEKLILLPPDVRIFPGHGPDSTIGVERTENPMLEPFNEPGEDRTEEYGTDISPVIIRNV